jgi:hypothetical protein
VLGFESLDACSPPATRSARLDGPNSRRNFSVARPGRRLSIVERPPGAFGTYLRGPEAPTPPGL